MRFYNVDGKMIGAKRRGLERWQALATIGILLLAYAAYAAYYTPSLSFAEVKSYLTNLDKADKVAMSSSNFSAVTGRATLSITPNAYIVNGTLTILTDDPDATIAAYSTVPLTKLSGGTQNVTYALPLTDSELDFDILIAFSSTTEAQPVTFTVAAAGVTNSTSVYANP
ncbi:MAG: hypothetical protein QXJ17_04485 [Nitrososphaeria archaeon]